MVFSVKINKNTYTVKVGDISSSPVRVEVDGQTFEVQVVDRDQGGTPVSAPSTAVQAPQEKKPTPPVAPSVAGVAAAGPPTDRSNVVVAPMPGKILKVNVKPGDSVSRGDVVCVLEAMKMEQFIKTGRDGAVAEVPVQAGQNVAQGSVLVRFQS